MERVLHISNDYAGSKVYMNLISELDNLNLKQIIYTPLKEQIKIGSNSIEFETIESRIVYSHILNCHLDRILYRRKIKKILKDIESKFDFSEISINHAHTWYSDGGVAYLLHKKYNIPYIITIRNTDLNVFQKYLIHERAFGRNILKNAQNIILISASYKDRILKEKSLQSIKSNILDKLMIIPNGVDKFWIDNTAHSRKNINSDKIKCLYVGRFTKGKNVDLLQHAIKELNHESLNVHLDLVGGGGKDHQKVLKIVNENKDIMTYHGQVRDKNTLKEYYKKADIFTMPSSYETFGLVYVEAMLQGLPILYTHDEGIDGFYDEKIGEKIISNDVVEIKKKLLSLVNNYNEYAIPTDRLIENHDWSKIAKKYVYIYKSVKRSIKR
ncbi:MAG: glycosyltransferase family 4 protein [Fermentimonas sp.]|nr:glycosyltransferase family 4 protein [Fermentimonas sp.]